MRVFKDVITGDELFTDSLSKFAKSEDGTHYIFHTKMITQKDGIDESLIGANASVEEQAEELEQSSRSNFDFVLANNLQEMACPAFSDKKTCQQYFKMYAKYLQEKLEEDKKADLKEALASFYKVIKDKDLGNFSFFVGEHDDAGESTCVMVEWNDDGVSGVARVFALGIIDEKV